MTSTAAEYLALRGGAGLVEGEHEIVWVLGDDAVGFLEDILSQEVAALSPGEVRRSLLLAPQGKLRASLWILRHQQGAGLVADVGFGQTVVEDLSHFKLRVDATIDAPEPMVELWGPRAVEVLKQAGMPTPSGWATDADAMVAYAPLGPLPRYLVTGIGGDRLASAGATRCGPVAATTVRVEAGEPKMGVDLDEGTIPQESGLAESAIAFDKGCFLGQELVARIDSRGHVNRRLLGIAVAGDVSPPLGSELIGHDRSLGRLTSIGESLELQSPVALALVRREASPGDDVAVRWSDGEARAAVRLLPLTDFKQS